VEREATLQFVPLAETAVTAAGQRRRNQRWVDYLVNNMELESLGYPIVNQRNGAYYIIDGQHRIEALKRLGLGDSTIECFVYTGLSEADEAARFLTWNNQLTVGAFDKFRIGVKAGFKAEKEIVKIVESVNLTISRESVPGAIGATGTLKRIYDRSGGAVLQRTLAIVRDAFGAVGFTALIMDATAHVVGRYGNLDDETLIRKLSRVPGGVQTVVGRAEVVRQQTGQPKTHCLAAEIVKLYNAGSRHPVSGRLTPWWKADALLERESA
jgi:hypothetical protein